MCTRRLWQAARTGEQNAMDTKTLPLVQMLNRDGFVPDPRIDVG
jgi:hypothetical protein